MSTLPQPRFNGVLLPENGSEPVGSFTLDQDHVALAAPHEPELDTWISLFLIEEVNL